MRRMRAIAGTGVWLAAIAVSSVALAEDPTGGIIPERKDVFSVYSDAYFNPDSAANGFGNCAAGSANGSGAAAGDQLFNPTRVCKFYVGGDVTGINRSQPKRRVYTREFFSGENGRKAISRFDSDELDFGNQNRYRGWIGIEFPSENRIEFSYFQTENFAATPLISTAVGTSLFDLPTNVGVAGYTFDFKGAELLYRWDIFDYWRQDWRVDLLLGIRYFGLNESAFYSDRFAFMTTRLTQDLVGPEIGLNARYEFCKVFEWDLTGKIGALCNSASNDLALGLNFQGVPFDASERQVTASSRFMEGRFVINFYPHPCIKLFAGWEFIWLYSVGTALGEFPHEQPFVFRDFRPNQKDSICYDGFLAGGEIKF